MWMLNTYWFFIILTAIRTGELWTMTVIIPVYMLLLHWLTEEDDNGTNTTTERPHSSTDDHVHWVDYDTLSDMDNSKTG